MKKHTFLKCLVLGIVASSAAFAGSLKAESALKTMSGERELLPKIWVPDPARSERESSSLGSWYDPERGLIPTHEIFETVASWKLLGQFYPNDIAVRSFCDDNPYLIENSEFLERVKRIMSSSVSVVVNEKHAKPVFIRLNYVGNVSSNAVSVHVRIDNYNQLMGMKGTGLLSKRYLNVDGRFFYIGVRGEVRGGEVRSRALQNEELLKAWEGEIRRCTWAHRLAEHGGDVESAANAVKQELLADREKRGKSPYWLPPHERMERVRRLMAERGYNSTNKPSMEVLNESPLVEAGVISPNIGGKLPSCTIPVSPISMVYPQQNRTIAEEGGKEGWPSVAFWIFFVLVLFAGSAVLGCRKKSGRDAAGQFRAYQEKVDRCLRTDRALRKIVTQRMLEEWAIIIRFFSSGDEPRRLCVPAVLFLWENIFKPKMSHDEVRELNMRIRRACGLDKVFSRRNFESISDEVIREIGYEPAWRNWLQLGDYAYSASDRIGGGKKLEAPLDFVESVYRLLGNWDGKFDDIVLLPIDWKRFFMVHPEFAEHELLVRYGVLDTEGQRECAERASRTSHQSKMKDMSHGVSRENSRLWSVESETGRDSAVHDQVARGASMLDGANTAPLLAFEKTEPQKVSRPYSRPTDNKERLSAIKRLIASGDVKGVVVEIERLIEDETNNLEVKILCYARLFKALTDDVIDDSRLFDLCDKLHNDIATCIGRQKGMQVNKRLMSLWDWLDGLNHVCNTPGCGISSNKLMTEYVLIAILVLAVFCGLVIWLVMCLH